MTKGTYDRKFIIPFLIIVWVPYIIGVIYTKIKGKSAEMCIRDRNNSDGEIRRWNVLISMILIHQ